MSLSDLPKILGSETILNEQFFEIRKDRLLLSNKSEYFYFTLVSSPTAVMVLATTRNGLLIINREYRHPLQKVIFSCPGGIQDLGEDTIECAQRELQEETGFSSTSFKIIGEAYPFPGFSSQKTIYVRAFDAEKIAEPTPEPSEHFETLLLSKRELFDLIKEGSAVDGLLLTSLFFNCLQDPSWQ